MVVASAVGQFWADRRRRRALAEQPHGSDHKAATSLCRKQLASRARALAMAWRSLRCSHTALLVISALKPGIGKNWIVTVASWTGRQEREASLEAHIALQNPEKQHCEPRCSRSRSSGRATRPSADFDSEEVPIPAAGEPAPAEKRPWRPADCRGERLARMAERGPVRWQGSAGCWWSAAEPDLTV